MPDQREVERACSEMLRNVDKIKQEARNLNNRHESLGQAYRNDRRFTSDAIRLRDAIRDTERAADKLKQHIDNIRRSNR